MRRALVLSGLLVAALGAAEMTLKSLVVPVFGPGGDLERRLTAQAGSGSLSSPVLERGHIDFFAAREGQPLIGQLEFDRARYEPARQQITGDERIRFSGSTGTVSGRGFDYDLGSNLLTLRAEVTATLRETRLAAPRAQVRFKAASANSDSPIAEAVLSGGIVIHDLIYGGETFERAETERARYDGATESISPGGPITLWRKGSKIVMGAGTAEFSLKRPAPSAPPHAEKAP